MEIDFEAFIKELQEVPVRTRRQGIQWRDQFRKKYRTELALVCLYLQAIGVLISEQADFDETLSCDFCKDLLNEHGFFVDGVTADGAWANMCPQCYMKKGNGIGWGVGQMYLQAGKGQWKLVAGGDPSDRP